MAIRAETAVALFETTRTIETTMMENQDPQHVARLADIEPHPDRLYSAFAALRNLSEGHTRAQDTFFDLELADRSALLHGKIWSNAKRAQAAARDLERGTAVKIMFHAKLYRDALQLDIHRIRAVAEDESDYDAGALFGEGHDLVHDIVCDNLAFDIETVPATDRRALPQTVAESLARHAERMDGDEAKVMSLSPFFGKVVSLAVGNADDDEKITVFAVPPGETPEGLPDWIRPVTEPDLLHAWWALAAAAKTVISFNGRGFDVPFLVARSLIHGIPARVDLLSHRFALRPHLDLYRALTHGERSLGPTSLDVVCWALGIESPKGQMDGSMVAPAYARGEIEEIATYNAQDVRATSAVYRVVRDRLLQFRDDW